MPEMPIFDTALDSVTFQMVLRFSGPVHIQTVQENIQRVLENAIGDGAISQGASDPDVRGLDSLNLIGPDYTSGWSGI